MTNPLLLESGDIFKNATTLDCIRQTLIIMKSDTNEDEVQDYLEERALPYLNNDLPDEVAIELYDLILYSIFLYPTKLSSFLDKIIPKANSNNNFLIIAVSLLSQIKKNKSIDPLPNYQHFINDVLNQISPQIKSSNQTNFKVYGHEIPLIFQQKLIVDLLSLTSITKQLISDFIPYLFSFKATTYLPQILQILSSITKEELNSCFPETISIDESSISLISLSDMTLLLPLITEQTFRISIPYIESQLKAGKRFEYEFSLNYLQKCSKYDIKIKEITPLFSPIRNQSIPSEIIDYLKQFDFKIIDIDFLNLNEIKDKNFLLRILPSTPRCRSSTLKDLLEECTDFEAYNKTIFNNEISKRDEITSYSFWEHILMLTFTQKCPDTILTKFCDLIKKVYNPRECTKLIANLITKFFPLNETSISFLSALVSSLRHKYNKSYFELSNMNEILKKVIEAKTNPCPSFWNLISVEAFNAKLKNNKSLICLYGYEFARGRYQNQFNFDSLSILPQNDESREVVLKFIKSNNLKEIGSYSDQALSFIITAFIYASNKQKMKIDGLSNESILPFIAIALNRRGYLTFSEEMNALILDAVKSLENNDSPMLVASIDSIFSHASTLADKKTFPLQLLLQIVDILSSYLMNGTYKADKLSLFALILQVTNLDEYGKSANKSAVFEFIIKSIPEIVDDYKKSDRFKKIQLNCDQFKNEQKWEDIIQNCSEKDGIKRIFFFEKMCTKKPSFKINNTELLSRCLNEVIQTGNVDDLLVVSQFIKEYSSNNENELILDSNQVPFEAKVKIFGNKINIDKIDVDQLLSYILEEQHPESNFFLFKYLFDLLMKDESTAISYLSIFFEKCYKKDLLTAKEILSIFAKNYENYGDMFVKAVSHFYLQDPKTKEFVKRPDLNSKLLPISELGKKVISRLFASISEKKDNFQAFYCLNAIAGSLPFLLENGSQRIIDSVLPVFDDISLLYLPENEENKNKRKTVFCALSFLIHAFISLRFLDSFFNWFFENLSTLSNSQVFAFITIIRCEFDEKNESIKYLKKYNFIEKVTSLLQREITETFKDSYFTNLLQIIKFYYNSFKSLTPFVQISIDEFKKTPYAFTTAFDLNLTKIPSSLQPSKFLALKEKDISHFFKQVEKPKSIFVTSSIDEKAKGATDEVINKFLSSYSNIAPPLKTIENVPSISIPRPYTNKMIRYIVWQRYWIILYAYFFSKITLLAEHYEILSKIANDLNKIKQEEEESGNKNEQINFDNFDFTQKEFNTICVKKYNVNSTLFNEIFEIIIENEEGFNSFLSIFSELLLNVSITSEEINKIIQLLMLMSKHSSFDEKFFESCGKNLLTLTMSPRFRNDSNLLLPVSNLFLQFKGQLPDFLIQLVAFMFMSKDKKLLVNSLQICARLKYNDYPFLVDQLHQILDKEVHLTNPSKDIIDIYSSMFPDMIETKYQEIFEIVGALLSNSDNLETVADLLNKFSPKRDRIITISFTDHKVYKRSSPFEEQTKESMRPIPDELKNKSAFWSYFEKIRQKLMGYIEDKLSRLELFDFLFEFPEVVDFKLRSKYFLSKMHRRVGYSDRNINFYRDNIIERSFEQMKNFTTKDWLMNFKLSPVERRDQVAVDAGGVRHDFLLSLVNAFCDPENGFFIPCSNESTVEPNPNCKDKLEYFEFFGKLIARCLIENWAVRAQFAPFFCKHILHRNLCIDDLKFYDDNIFDSVESVLKTPDVEDLEIYFQIGDYELVQNGEDILVTEGNKNDYAKLVWQYYLINRSKPQIDAFCSGFDSIISHRDIRYFTQGELNLLICGFTNVTMEVLRKVFVAGDGYSDDSPIIERFFRVISKWDSEMISFLFIFTISASSLPLAGVKIKIQRAGNTTDYPKAHTCFHYLDLPPYETDEIMNKMLSTAVIYGYGYGFA